MVKSIPISKQRILDNIKVDINNCWNWTLSARAGYGQLKHRGRTYKVHRIAANLWLDFDLNSPLLICHRCDNKKCVNPEHLFIGTHIDNAQDMVKKNRCNPPIGERNSKLTKEDILLIRLMRKFKTKNIEIAKTFNISPAATYNIAVAKRWRHI